jgi:protein-S-isoprenylcysteine O-methyltransferase Ste14
MSSAQIPDPRPKSAVPGGVGWAGMAGLVLWVVFARRYGLDGPYAALAAVMACGVPMLGWSLLVDRVHRRPSTGMDWDRPLRPLSESFDISLVKLTGLWATWAIIAVLYCIGRWYWRGQYLFAMEVMGTAIPAVLLLSVPYVIWIDRRLNEPRDGAYAFGQMLLNLGPPDREMLREHLRSWGVKGFFTAFMISIVPGNFADVIRPALSEILTNPVTLSRWLISAMFLVDVAFATVGYLMTMRPLDAHIRSANPYAAGWMAALICYPPFLLMSDGGPLDYHPATQDWVSWMDGHPVLLTVTGATLVLLTGIYAWATVAFGIRFSNLTNRGVLTHGPYRWSKHPAYLSKNTFWWLATLPFLATSGSLTDMIRNSAILAMINGVYYWRARTEERHLMAEPAYRAYAEWMDRNAPLPRLFRWLRGDKTTAPIAAAE